MSVLQLPPLSLYIHIPWCQRKCPYCDFNSHQAGKEIPEGLYINALLADLDQDLALAQGRELISIFIGGGTPSLFSGEGIKHLLSEIRERLPFAEDCEITLEANPGSSEAEKFASFLEAGVNRISLGVQSLDDAVLESIGRVHNADEAMAAIELLHSLPLRSFNLDLMHGLPGQRPEQAGADLRRALSADPPHLSWYQLTIEPNTAFYSHPPALPGERILGEIQDQGEEILREAGLKQYEVSAYAKNGHHCRHNRNYWEFGDYLGIGAGAHGKISDVVNERVMRISKTRQPETYLQKSGAGFTARIHSIPERELAGEFMMNALRLVKGFEPGLFSKRTGMLFNDIRHQIDELETKGLMACEGNSIRPSELGRRYLDNLVSEFF